MRYVAALQNFAHKCSIPATNYHANTYLSNYLPMAGDNVRDGHTHVLMRWEAMSRAMACLHLLFDFCLYSTIGFIHQWHSKTSEAMNKQIQLQMNEDLLSCPISSPSNIHT